MLTYLNLVALRDTDETGPCPAVIIIVERQNGNYAVALRKKHQDKSMFRDGDKAAVSFNCPAELATPELQNALLELVEDVFHAGQSERGKDE